MTPSRLGRSLTLRLALLYAASTLLILLSVAFYMIQVIDSHFAEQDAAEMRGKLELAARLVAQARQEGTLAGLSRRLDDALVGHHHLSLALFAGDERPYAFGPADHPPALRAAAATAVERACLVSWRAAAGTRYRGLALRLASASMLIAVAVDTTHHEAFIDDFRMALRAVLALATLVAAALGWAAARAGLAPLRQTAQLARQITAERLDRRLPTERIPPELEELSAAFNAMLDRLRDSFERLSGFAADLAHEMRTPVNNLMMQTQVMLAQARSAEEYREVLASNLEECERLARTIGDMLFLAKADNGLIVPSLEPVALAREVGELFEFFEALAEEKGVRLECTGEAVVSGDRLMLRRALANLLSNGIRYAPAGGTVRVHLGTDGAEAVAAIENPCAVRPSEPLERLFERFCRADPARRGTGEGTGLGLAITRSIARAHGGDAHASLTVDSIRFELRLPREGRVPVAGK